MAQNHLFYPLAKPIQLTQLGTFAPCLRGWEGPGVSPQHFWKNSSILWIGLGPIFCGFWGELLTEISRNIPSLRYWEMHRDQRTGNQFEQSGCDSLVSLMLWNDAKEVTEGLWCLWRKNWHRGEQLFGPVKLLPFFRQVMPTCKIFHTELKKKRNSLQPVFECVDQNCINRE